MSNLRRKKKKEIAQDRALLHFFFFNRKIIPANIMAEKENFSLGRLPLTFLGLALTWRTTVDRTSSFDRHANDGATMTSRPYQPNGDIALAARPGDPAAVPTSAPFADRSPEQARTLPASSNGAKRSRLRASRRMNSPVLGNFPLFFFPSEIRIILACPLPSCLLGDPSDARLINEQGTLAPKPTLRAPRIALNSLLDHIDFFVYDI